MVGGLTLVAVMAVVWLGFKFYLTRQVEDEIRRTVARVPGVARVDYRHLSISPLPMRLEMRDAAIYLTGRSTPVRIDRLRIPHLTLADPVPSALTAHVVGLHLSETHLTDRGLQRLWQVLGYGSVVLDIDLTYTYDALQKSISVERMHVSGADLGDLEVALRIRQVDLARMVDQADNALYWKLALPVVALESFQLTYQDASLARRLGALENGQAVNQSIQQYLRKVQAHAGPQPDDLLQHNVAAVLQFLNQPEMLRVQAQPAKPTSLLRLMLSGGDPVRIMQLLNLSIQD